jgi:hypothetical protein
MKVVRASSDTTAHGLRLPPAAPVLDYRERIREGFPSTAWCLGMDDPAFVVVLDEEGMERDQELR